MHVWSPRAEQYARGVESTVQGLTPFPYLNGDRTYSCARFSLTRTVRPQRHDPSPSGPSDGGDGCKVNLVPDITGPSVAFGAACSCLRPRRRAVKSTSTAASTPDPSIHALSSTRCAGPSEGGLAALSAEQTGCFLSWGGLCHATRRLSPLAGPPRGPPPSRPLQLVAAGGGPLRQPPWSARWPRCAAAHAMGASRSLWRVSPSTVSPAVS